MPGTMFIYEPQKDGSLLITSSDGGGRFHPDFLKTCIYPSGIDRYKVIRKYIPLDILKLWLSADQIYMDQVLSWGDNFELPFLKFKIIGKIPPREYLQGHVVPTIYGQSWSMGLESYEMWKTYASSDGKTTVCIETTIEKLLTIVTNNRCPQDSIRAGEVKYLSKAGLKRKLSSCGCYSSDDVEIYSSFFPKTLFWKRREFSSEKEFRVVQILDSQTAMRYSFPPRVCYRFRPEDFIDKVIFAPDTDSKDYYNGVAFLNSYRISEDKIIRSDIFDSPCGTIRIS